MGYKGAVFDLDGVIVDTARFHYLAWRELAERLGFEFTEEQNERLKGVSRAKSLEILLEIGNLSLSEAEKEELAKQKNRRYRGMLEKLTERDILPGAGELLQELREAGIRTALGSASKNAPFILERLGLSNSFDVIVDGNAVAKAKPDPEIFLKAAQGMGLKPEECVVFEDSAAGIEAAKRGGMYAVGVGNMENLQGADFVIIDLEEFRKRMRDGKIISLSQEKNNL